MLKSRILFMKNILFIKILYKTNVGMRTNFISRFFATSLLFSGLAVAQPATVNESPSYSQSLPTNQAASNLYGPPRPEEYRLDLSFGPNNGFLLAGENQHERNLVASYMDSDDERKALAGFRYFPRADDLLEVKAAAQDIKDDDGHEWGALAEVTLRKFLKPGHKGYVKFKGGIARISDPDGDATEAYIYGRHAVGGPFTLLGTYSLVNQHDSASDTSELNQNINGGMIVSLPRNHYAFGGVGGGAVNTTAAFGISKAANSHGNGALDRLAYVANFQRNNETKFALFGVLYGKGNKFGREPVVGIEEGMNNTIVLDPRLNRLRRFDATENSSTLYDIAPFALFGIHLNKDLGHGMTLTTTDVDNSVVLWRDGRSLIFFEDEVSRTDISGIPHASTIREDANRALLGVRIAVDEFDVTFIAGQRAKTGEKPKYEGTIRLQWPQKK